MVRLISTAALIVSSTVLIGCQTTNTGRGQIVPPPTAATSGVLGAVNIAEATEADLVEQMANNRQAYHRGLELLVQYYTRTGNNRNLNWAKTELAALNTMPKYKYIIEAEVLPENLKATTLIPEADALYNEAVQLEKEAGPLPFAKNEDALRLALDKYTQLMRKHPSSDKIDDAAFKSGGILEYFKDYTIALLYYQRAYQWDPETPYPARFKAASILDRYLYQRAEALDLYRQAIKEEREFAEWVEFAERRIKELTKTEEGVK
jgi:tetratricopeptide (TPR) repeat protein